MIRMDGTRVSTVIRNMIWSVTLIPLASVAVGRSPRTSGMFSGLSTIGAGGAVCARAPTGMSQDRQTAAQTISAADRGDDYEVRQARSTVLKHVQFRGSNRELLKWFEENEDKLVFDPKAKVFRVEEGE